MKSTLDNLVVIFTDIYKDGNVLQMPLDKFEVYIGLDAGASDKTINQYTKLAFKFGLMELTGFRVVSFNWRHVKSLFEKRLSRFTDPNVVELINLVLSDESLCVTQSSLF